MPQKNSFHRDTRFETEKLSGYGKDATLCKLINNPSRRTAKLFMYCVLSGPDIKLKNSFSKDHERAVNSFVF